MLTNYIISLTGNFNISDVIIFFSLSVTRFCDLVQLSLDSSSNFNSKMSQPVIEKLDISISDEENVPTVSKIKSAPKSKLGRGFKKNVKTYERPIVIDLNDDDDNFDMDKLVVYTPKKKSNTSEDADLFKRNSFGENIIQPGQSNIKKKKVVTFNLQDSSEEDEIQIAAEYMDYDTDDDMPLAARVRRDKINVQMTTDDKYSYHFDNDNEHHDMPTVAEYIDFDNDDEIPRAERVRRNNSVVNEYVPIAHRLRGSGRNKDLPPVLPEEPIDARTNTNRQQSPEDLTDPNLIRIFQDDYNEEFEGFDPMYNPYRVSRTSVIVEPTSKITYFDLIKNLHLNVTKDQETCVDWLKSMDLLAPKNSPCPKCSINGRDGGILKYYYSAAIDRKCGTYLQCAGEGRRCRARYSPFTNTYFDGTSSKLDICKVLELLFCWIYRVPIHLTMRLVDTTKKTAIDYYNYCREICAVSLEQQNGCILGGLGHIIEIDESKLFKRMYHRGRFLSFRDGWAFGGIDRTTKERFVVLVPDRTEATLLPIIQKYIKPGSTIMSDEWKAYYNLDKHGYVHKTVNHSKRFVDEHDRSVHTQCIENNWRYLKATFPKNGTSNDMKESYVHEYIYRQVYKNNFVNRFFDDLKTTYPWKLRTV